MNPRTRGRSSARSGRRPRRSVSPRSTLVWTILLAVVSLTPAFAAPALAPSTAVPAAHDRPLAGSNGALALGSSLGPLPGTFFGTNYNYAAPNFNNSSIASLVNATPIRWLRFPLSDTGYRVPFVWDQVTQFCAWIACHSVATAGGPNESAAQAAADVQAAERIGVHPDYWTLGNEPNLWSNSTPLGYAELVQGWIRDVRAFDPTARFVGVDISGVPGVGDEFLANVTALNGPNLSAVALQLYPQTGGTSLAAFMAGLTAPTSVGAAVVHARSVIAAACPSCRLPIFVEEFNGGSEATPQYAPYRESAPNAVFFAASMVEGLRVGLAQFMPWTLTAVPAYKCDFALIELSEACDGRTLNPTYYLYSELLTGFTSGNLWNASIAGEPDVYAIVDNASGASTVLAVNANLSTDASFELGFSPTACAQETLLDANASGPVASGQAPVTRSDGTRTTFPLPPLSVLTLRLTPASGPCAEVPLSVPSTGGPSGGTGLGIAPEVIGGVVFLLIAIPMVVLLARPALRNLPKRRSRGPSAPPPRSPKRRSR